MVRAVLVAKRLEYLAGLIFFPLDSTNGTHQELFWGAAPWQGQASTLEWQSSESNRAEEVPPTRGSWSKNNAWSWKGKGRWKPHWAQAHQSGENQDQLKWKEADQANQVHQSWEDQDQPKWKEADQANQAHHSWEDQDQPEWNQADEARQVHQSWENKDQPKWKEAHELNQGQQSWEDQDQPKWKEADQAPQSWEDQDQQKEAQAQQSWADHDQRKEADQAQQSWEDQDQQKEAQAQQSWADHDQRKEADQAQQSWEDQDQQKEAGQAQQSWGDQDQPERKEADQANQAHQSWEALDQGTAPEQDSDQKPGHLSEIVTTQVKRLPRPKLQAPENASAKRRLRLPQGLDPGSSSSWAKDPGSSSSWAKEFQYAFRKLAFLVQKKYHPSLSNLLARVSITFPTFDPSWHMGSTIIGSPASLCGVLGFLLCTPVRLLLLPPPPLVTHRHTQLFP